MKTTTESERLKAWRDTLCSSCQGKYDKLREEVGMKSLDEAIKGREAGYEEEIDLYKTYGGD